MYFPAFPKIFAFGNKAVSDIFMNPVEVTEKVDGSQFGFGKLEGQVMCRSKGRVIDMSNPDHLFEEGVAVVKSLKDKLPEGIIFHGEYLKKPKHNTLKYDCIPSNHIALFSYYDCNNKGKFDRHILGYYAVIFNMDIVPLLYEGEIKGPKSLDILLEAESFLGGTKVEGVVVKNWYEWLFNDQLFFCLAAKYVSERFKEQNGSNWKKQHTSKGQLQEFIDSFRTEARWEKAVQHLRDNGELLNEPKDIGPLLKEINVDLIEECEDLIKEKLWMLFRKQILKGATIGFPEWYKKKLLADQFDG